MKTRDLILSAITLSVVSAQQRPLIPYRSPDPPPIVEESQRFSLHLEVENPVAKLGAPVFIRIMLKNIGSDPVKIPGGFLSGSFGLTVLDSSGKEILATQHFKNLAMDSLIASHGVPPLGPGQSRSEAGLLANELTKLFQLTQPGTYTVQAFRVIGGTRDVEEKVTSNIAAFEIVPPGSPKLQTPPDQGIRPLASMFPDDLPATVTISAEPAHFSITAHEPVKLNLRIVNITGTKLNFPVEQSYLEGHGGQPDFRVSITGPTGERVDVFSARDIFNSGYDLWPLPPGASYAEPLFLNRWVSFDQEGHYSMAIYVPQAAAPALVEVDVSRRDPRRIEDLCRTLEDEAKRGDNLIALNSLSLMRDEIAIRHLAELRGDPLVPKALALMDTVEAVSAIKDLAWDPDRAVASRAREILVNMQTSSKDDAVKQAAKTALSQLQ